MEKTELTQMQRLQAFATKKVKHSSMLAFADIVVINVGAPPVPHYPKIKDENGANVKDSNGKDKRAEQLDGYTFTFAEYGTAKMIKVVLPAKCQDQLVLLRPYKISGLGYDIRNANMLFLEKDVKISNF